MFKCACHMSSPLERNSETGWGPMSEVTGCIDNENTAEVALLA